LSQGCHRTDTTNDTRIVVVQVMATTTTTTTVVQWDGFHTELATTVVPTHVYHKDKLQGCCRNDCCVLIEYR
jgi:hypothetical protein